MSCSLSLQKSNLVTSAAVRVGCGSPLPASRDVDVALKAVVSNHFGIKAALSRMVDLLEERTVPRPTTTTRRAQVDDPRSSGTTMDDSHDGAHGLQAAEVHIHRRVFGQQLRFRISSFD